jgi:hypothetical protein
MSDLGEMGCGEFADRASELALGVLTGRQRAAATAHLERCRACRENVRQLAATAEDLLGLLPAIEPGRGFETRVMERLGLVSAAPRPGRGQNRGRNRGRVLAVRTRRMIAVAVAVAAVLLAVVVSGLGWGLRSAVSSPPVSPLRSAALLTASHQAIGRVFFYGGSCWTFMSVSMGTGTVDVICQLESRDGHFTTAGSFWLTDGHGSWGSVDPANAGPLAGARLISTTGVILATATI